MNGQNNKEYLRTIIDSVNDPLLVIDQDLTIKFLNKAALEAASLTEDNFGKVHCYEVLHHREKPCDSYGEDCLVKEVYALKKPARALRKLFAGKNNEGMYEISAVPVANDAGEIVEVVEILRDVTDSALIEELKESEQNLKQKHEKLKALFKKINAAKKEWEMTMDCIGDMVMLINADGTIKRCNKAVTDFVRKPYRQILGGNWKALLSENNLEVQEHLLLEKGVEYYHRPSGRTLVRYSYNIKTDAEPSASVITLHDVTERQRIAQELEKKNKEINTHRKNLRRALEELSILIRRVITEKEFGTYFTLPPNLEQCWKVMNCEHKNCPCYGREPLRCWQTAGTHCTGIVQGVFAEKIGQCEKCEFYRAATEDPTYQIGMQFNNMMHVLELKNKELEKAYAELKATQSQILQHEKMASIGQLAAGVAHEINNPVGFVTSNLGSLNKYVTRLTDFIKLQSEVLAASKDVEAAEEVQQQRKKLKIDFILEDSKDLVAESLNGVDRVKKIVQNLKNFSRVDQSNYTSTDINGCMEDTLNIVWNELKYKTTVTKEYDELPHTMCYPQQLNQVFMNILINAVHSIEKQGEITIKTWAEDDNIYIAISDTGSGIAKENLNRLFEPFFTTKAVGKGTGLGLSIVYDIVTKKHNGEITVESEVGKGSTFTVRIPVVEEE